VQTEQSIRLGYWMDWDRDEDWQKPPDQRRSYFTMSEENNYTIWSFLKKCHSRALIYRGYDAMPWCPRCSVGLSQMEMSEGYQLVAHRALFVRFPLRGRPGENLLVWTTTPWTLSSNVAAAVNPGLTYLKVLHKEQIYYLAKGAFTAQRLEEQWKKKEWVPGVPKLSTLEQHFKSKGGYEIVGEVRGADMVGWQYDGPFDELPEPSKSARDVHRVIAWKDVGETEGTGIVHIAPGCGKEDFNLGKEEGLPPVAPLDEYGVFLAGFRELTGKAANDHATTDWILDNLQHKGLLLAVEKYPHSYPHCWRCKTELLFRLVEEWFIDMRWRDEIKRVVEQATFLPESINGKARELDWLTNMGDWMISKKRFWGLALPIWVDEKTGDFEVIGSREELRERAVEGWEQFEGHTPHRPWIDLVKIRNPKTGNLMSRIPDVGNPWLDAGIVPFSTMHYNCNRDEWAKWFPADFITESFPGQFRNWFYAILAMSTMMENRPPFKALLGHGLVRDQKGEDMHKTKGNAIPFDGAVDTGYRLFHEREPKLSLEAQAHRDLPEGWLEGSLKEETILLDNKPKLVVSAGYPPMGADEARWLYCRHNPAQNINFGPEPAEELRSRFLLKLWNVYGFFCNYAQIDGFDPSAPLLQLNERPDLDRWILSELQHLIRTAREAFESYNLMAFCLEAERFVDDKLSNWYVRRSRRRFWKSEHGTDKQAAYQTLYTVLLTLAKLFAPIVPFLTETMYQNLRTTDQPESIHLCDFPTVDEALIDAELSDEVNCLLTLVSLGLAVRNSVKPPIRVRQPLAELKVQADSDSEAHAAIERFGDQIREELNVKAVSLHDPEWGPLLSPEVKPNMKTLGPKFGARLKDVIAAIAAADTNILAMKVRAGETIELPCAGETILLEPADLSVSVKAPEGWVGTIDGDTQVALDTRITQALALEGTARDVVRHIQDQRKEADLEMEHRIVLYLGTESEKLHAAIDAHRNYIAAETLTVEWSSQPLTDPEVHRATVKVEGQSLTIELRRVK
jgi:isoleucyl-tRNA synthetase